MTRRVTGLLLLVVGFGCLMGCAQTRGLSEPAPAQLRAELRPGQAIYGQLKDGRAYRGAFQRVDDAHLWLQGPQSELKLRLAEVRYIDFQAATARPVFEGAMAGVASLLGAMAFLALLAALAL